MTYMQPTYYRILGFDKDYTDLAGKYGLLLYRDEGDEHPALHPSQLTQTDDRDWSIAKSAKIRPSGVPALFIPGNAGSARQVRSIAKEATRYYNEKIQKGLRAPWSKPIDFFTVDFNEEFSAFHGQLLLDQSRYVNEAIAYILSLYSHSNTAFPRPTSVLIIGHSMGGIVARTLFTKDNFIPGSINTILTIASPHMVPPLALDYTVTSIYDKIEEFWIKGYDTPHVVKQIGIALVEVVDASTPNQVKPLEERMKIFRNHLLWEDSLSTSSISKDSEMVDLSGVSHSFEEGDIWVSPARKPVTISQQTSKAHYHILTIPEHKDLDTLTLLTNLRFGSQEDFSLLLCKDKPQQGSNDKTVTCESDSLSLTAIPGSTRGSTMPLFTGEYFTGHEFRFMSVALSDLEGFRYVVILNKRSVYTDTSFVIVEFKNEASTAEVVHTTAIGLLRSGLTRNKFPENPSLVSTIRLPNVDNSILAYKLKVHGGSCAGAPMERFAPMIRQSSWAINEDKFSVNVANKENGIDINFHGDLPYYDKVLLRANNGIELMFWRDPTCKEPLSFTLTIDTYGSLGKIVIRYRTIVLVFTFMVVILTIRAQIKDWCRNESFKPFGVVLSSLLRTTFWKLSLLLVFVSFIQSLMSKNIVIVSPEAMANGIRVKSRSWISRAWFDNALLGRNETFFWLLLPIFLHVSVGMVAFVWFGLSTIVRAISFFTRLLTRNTSTQHR
ncbi:GPI inositol deacylase [Entomortierella chlamydospora]|uniref:GPI inositol-deacylase n=1 Tax=Entomortierella chlamydospora TaxID=101097 RepID=A0A9P6T0N4_9FUNG|nr:GPI inositol deacylase [Entomortierella chlamydospora]